MVRAYFLKGVSKNITTAELMKTINQAWAISATAIQQNGSVWKVHTSNGIFGFRQMKVEPDKLRQLAEVPEIFKNHGYPNLSSFLVTKSGEPFVTIANHNYVLLKWHEGEHPLFTSPNHLQKTAKLLGKLHHTSKTVSLPKNWQLINCLAEYRIRTAFLKNLSVKLHGRKSLNRIDRAIIDQGEHFLNQAVLSVKGLTDLNYHDWLLNTPEKGFCHNDPAPLNIIVQNQNWILIDFELSAYDAFIREFAVLLARVLKINAREPKVGDILKTSYAEERVISNEEFKYLPYLLCFPQRFWRLCSQRFEEKIDWTETHFWRKLREINDDEKKRFPFLTNILPELDPKGQLSY